MQNEPGKTTLGNSLADLLDRILERGVVIVGDIKVNLSTVELLTIKIRLLIASVETAKKLGIDWWEHDRYFSSQAVKLEERVSKLEQAAPVKA